MGHHLNVGRMTIFKKKIRINAGEDEGVEKHIIRGIVNYSNNYKNQYRVSSKKTKNSANM